MRRYSIFLLLLTLGLGLTAAFAAHALDAPKDAVVFTEEVVAGDPAAAAGLSVTLLEELDGHDYWQSTIRFSETNYSANTEFSFQQDRPRSSGEMSRSIELCDAVSDAFAMYEDGLYGASEALSQDMRTFEDSVSPGEERSTTFRVADYFEFYPFAVNIILPDCFYATSTDNTPSAQLTALTDLQEFFKIPVLPDEFLRISVGKSVNGGSSTGISAVDYGDSFSLYTQSAANESALYFYFSNRTNSGALVDTSQIPGGYGIYCLPYGRIDTEDVYKGEAGFHGTDVFTDKLAVFFPLAPEVDIRRLTLSPDGTKLYLQTAEDGAYLVRVLDAASGAVLQTLELAPCGDEWAEYGEGENFLFVRFGAERFFVLAMEPDGLLRLALCHEMTELDRDEAYLPWYSTQNRVLCFDGKRLAVVCNNRRAFSYEDYQYTAAGCGFSVSIYDTTGLACYAIYQSSLDQATDVDGNKSVTAIAPFYDTPIAANFA